MRTAGPGPRASNSANYSELIAFEASVDLHFDSYEGGDSADFLQITIGINLRIG